MRRISELATSALTGSQSGVRLVADVWRGGALLTQDGPLPVASWQVQWDTTRQVQGQASLTIADADGSLAPWAWDDPLGAGGSRLHLRYQMPQVGPAEEVSLGWFRIVRNPVAESWRIHPGAQLWVSTGATIQITAEELTWQVQHERFLAPESPRVTNSALGEVRRLLDGIVPVEVSGVTDGPVPGSVTYSRERMDAVEAVLRARGAVHRMTGDGLLEVLPQTPGPVVWTIAPSKDDEQGVLVDLSRAQDAAKMPNAAVAEGTTADGAQLVGRAVERTGPLAFGGPHGRIPAFLASPVLGTQAAVDGAADTFLGTTVSKRRTVLPITCLPNPALQGYDTAALATPVGDLVGTVETVSLSGDANGVHPMTLGLSVDAEQLTILARKVRRARG